MIRLILSILLYIVPIICFLFVVRCIDKIPFLFFKPLSNLRSDYKHIEQLTIKFNPLCESKDKCLFNRRPTVKYLSSIDTLEEKIYYGIILHKKINVLKKSLEEEIAFYILIVFIILLVAIALVTSQNEINFTKEILLTYISKGSLISLSVFFPPICRIILISREVSLAKKELVKKKVSLPSDPNKKPEEALLSFNPLSTPSSNKLLEEEKQQSGQPPIEINNNITIKNTQADSNNKQKGNFGVGIVNDSEIKGNAELRGETNESGNQNLAQAVEQINKLLKELVKNYPINTTSEQMKVAAKIIEQIENNPSLKQKTINAAKEAGLATFKKSLNNPVGALITGAVEHWLEAEAR